MRLGNIIFPDPVLQAQEEGNLVIFAGAGVSMGPPANYPNFKKLAQEIACGAGHTLEDSEPIDRFLGRVARKHRCSWAMQTQIY
jgi:hypothetical protein